MFAGFKTVPPTDGVGITASMTATIGSVSSLPPGSGKLAIAIYAALPELTADAKSAHEVLVETLSGQRGAINERKGGVSLSRKQEAAADKAVKALHSRLEALVGEEVEGATALLGYFFPLGVTALIKATGRPQRGLYDTWEGTWAGRPQQGSPADLDIAASLANVAAKLQRFADVLDGKDTVSRAADAAIDRRGDAHTAWLDAWGDLVDAVELIQAKNPEAFKAWLSPYLEWRQAQQARSGRRESDQPRGDATDAPTSGGPGAEHDSVDPTGEGGVDAG